MPLHVCPICNIIYNCRKGCCNSEKYPCPRCMPNNNTKVHYLKDQRYKPLPFYACKHTLLYKAKPIFVERFKIIQKIKRILFDEGDFDKGDFKIVKFKESHRLPVIKYQSYKMKEYLKQV